MCNSGYAIQMRVHQPTPIMSHYREHKLPNGIILHEYTNLHVADIDTYIYVLYPILYYA